MDTELDDAVDEVTNLGGDENAENEDRGDAVDSGVSREGLQALVEGAAAGGAEEEEGQTAGRAGPGVPYVRFSEVNQQRKDAEARAAALEQELEQLRSASAARDNRPAPAAFDADAKEAEYIDALLDGDREKAAELRREITRHQQRAAIAEYREIQSREQAFNALQDVTNQTLEAYPWLDTPAGAEALELIVALRDKKIAEGMPASTALAHAVSRIAPKHAPTEGDPPSTGLRNPKASTDTRVAKSLARGAEAATLQPPSVQAGVGNRAGGGRVDPNNLTEEQFDNLTEAEKSKLRGD